jgi:hypothetical protein
LSVSSNSVNVGDPVTFTATVSGTSSGSVQFVVDGVNFGDPVALTGDTAFLTTNSLAVGSHTVSAVFVPVNGNFAGSVSTQAVVNIQESESAFQELTFAAISGANNNSGVTDRAITFRIVGPNAGAGPFTYVINWGDGNADFFDGQPQVFEVNHTYMTEGTYTPTVTIIDMIPDVPYDVALTGGSLTIVFIPSDRT